MNPEDRLGTEAIGFAMRAISAAMSNLQQFANTIHRSSPPSHEQRLVLYMLCWTVIDQTHMLRQLLDYMAKKKSGKVKEFYEKHEQATLIRNKMDHLRNNIKNLVSAKKALSTVFGSLSFFDFPIYVNHKPDFNAGDVIVITFGSAYKSEHYYQMVNPAGETVPFTGASLFQFSAFDLTFKMYPLFQDVPDLAAYIEDNLRKQGQEELQKAKERGDSTEDFLHQGSGSLFAAATFTFSKPSSSSE